MPHASATLACPHGDDEHCDRSSTAAGRRRGQGPRLHALRGRPPRPRACCTRGWCSPPRRTGGSRASTATAALGVAGVVAVLTAADLPFVGGRRRARRASRSRARRSCTPGQPVALVVAESEAAAADGVDAGHRRHRAARGRARPRDGDGAGRGAGRGSTSRPATAPTSAARHAAAGGGDEGGDDGGAVRQRRRAPAHGRRRRGRGAGRRRGARGRALQHELDPPGLPRAAGRHGVAGARRRARRCSSSTQGAFSTRQQLADLLGWSHDRVRVRPAPLGGAFGGKLMICRAAGGRRVRAASSARCASRSRASRTSPPSNPAPGRAHRPRGRRRRPRAT